MQNSKEKIKSLQREVDRLKAELRWEKLTKTVYKKKLYGKEK
jgi:uncharacterized small protein (DUF1192 family)